MSDEHAYIHRSSCSVLLLNVAQTGVDIPFCFWETGFGWASCTGNSVWIKGNPFWVLKFHIRSTSHCSPSIVQCKCTNVNLCTTRQTEKP